MQLCFFNCLFSQLALFKSAFSSYLPHIFDTLFVCEYGHYVFSGRKHRKLAIPYVVEIIELLDKFFVQKCIISWVLILQRIVIKPYMKRHIGNRYQNHRIFPDFPGILHKDSMVIVESLARQCKIESLHVDVLVITGIHAVRSSDIAYLYSIRHASEFFHIVQASVPVGLRISIVQCNQYAYPYQYEQNGPC